MITNVTQTCPQYFKFFRILILVGKIGVLGDENNVYIWGKWEMLGWSVSVYLSIAVV